MPSKPAYIWNEKKKTIIDVVYKGSALNIIIIILFETKVAVELMLNSLN